MITTYIVSVKITVIKIYDMDIKVKIRFVTANPLYMYLDTKSLHIPTLQKICNLECVLIEFFTPNLCVKYT